MVAGSTTGRRIQTCHSDHGRGRCSGSGGCDVTLLRSLFFPFLDAFWRNRSTSSVDKSWPPRLRSADIAASHFARILILLILLLMARKGAAESDATLASGRLAGRADIRGVRDDEPSADTAKGPRGGPLRGAPDGCAAGRQVWRISVPSTLRHSRMKAASAVQPLAETMLPST
ncbi:hypothetical protein GCM10011392_17460 [Wenxinia marina]|nr:hypothetical protein GCM10011392_17460 [Wenxinia marina]